tara:strand:- start:2085 stop:3209 length:1125 start_codon:yes stop_codon:yes gene_type:complete
MINKLKKFVQISISDQSILYKLLKKLYFKGKTDKIFYPVDLKNLSSEILKKNFFVFNKKNYLKLRDSSKFFFISDNRCKNSYESSRLDKMINLVKNGNFELVYDGNCSHNTEIVSKEFLDNYMKKFDINHYPYKSFYIIKSTQEKVNQIGSNHRSYNFNGSFKLPLGGRSIGDQGDVDFRLKFIPDLTNKTFLDVGAEEGYATFEAIKKNAKYAKGLNIYEDTEYDFFPDYLREKNITSRSRNEIEKTQKFLLKEHGLENQSKIHFEYKNIYDLGKDQFDFVYCFGVLYHLKNPYKAIENLFKTTKETLIIETQGIKNEKYLNAKISKSDGFVRHSSNSLKFLLEKAGFKKVEILQDVYLKSWSVSNIVLKGKK